jgi:hypothetical protein
MTLNLYNFGIYKFHNKMHQQNIRIILYTILPCKRSFLIDFLTLRFFDKNFSRIFLLPFASHKDSVHLIFLDLTTAIMRGKQTSTDRVIKFSITQFYPHFL